MNIFWLDRSATLAARYYADTHVAKALHEAVQVLMSARHLAKAKASWPNTHGPHPHTRWVAISRENYWKLYSLACALELEYAARWNKRHLCSTLLREELSESVGPEAEATIPPFIGPQQYAVMVEPHVVGWDRVVEMYRLYYYHGKGAVCKWTVRERPWWWFNRKENDGHV